MHNVPAKVDEILVTFLLELCHNSIAGSGSSQRKEQVVAVRVGDSAWCGGENLETCIKFLLKKKFFRPQSSLQ